MESLLTELFVAACRAQWWKFISPIQANCFAVMRTYGTKAVDREAYLSSLRAPGVTLAEWARWSGGVQ